MSASGSLGISGKAAAVEKAAPEDRVSAVRVFLGMGLLVGAIILFDGFPDRVGAIRSADVPGRVVPLLSPVFREHIPLLNLWWGLSLALGLVLLYDGRWTRTTRLIDIAVNLLAMAVLGTLLTIGPIVGGPPTWAIRGGLSGVYLIRIEEKMVPTLDLAFKILIGLLLLIKLVSVYVQLRQAFPKRTV